MTDAGKPVERPSPAVALERTFEAVRRERMEGVPMLNPALEVEAVGFRPWREHWLGILITPWFMNVVLMPRVDAAWQPVGAREATLGDYQACSLFSPMFDFADQREARATALAALDALFDPASREAAPVRAQAPAAEAQASVEDRPTLSKRDFLFGATPRGDRGP
jgi:hypothetical protein